MTTLKRINLSSNNNSSIYIHLLYLLVFLVPIVELVQGFVYKGDTSKLLTNLFSFFSVFLIIITLISSSRLDNFRFKIKNILFIMWVIISLLIVMLTGIYGGGISYDVSAIFRSLILGTAVFTMALHINDDEKSAVLRNCSLYIWLFITVAVLYSVIFSSGLYTYEEFKIGHKSYFPSLNELNYVYFTSWLILFLAEKNYFKKLFYLLSTIVIYLFIGNKSFVALFMFIFFLIIWNKIPLKSRIVIIITSIVTTLTYLNTSHFDNYINEGIVVLISTLATISSGGEKLLNKISYLSIFSALVSERDVLILFTKDIFENEYNFYNIIFGKSLSVYGELYALKKGVGTFSFSEIDVVDLFMSYGINGIAIFTTIMLKIYNKKSPYDNKVFFWYKTLLVLLFILTGTLTGHIFFFGFTSFIFALYSGLLSSKNNLEPSYRFVGK